MGRTGARCGEGSRRRTLHACEPGNELDSFRGAEDPAGFVLNTVQQKERGLWRARPERAAVLHPSADVGLVDSREGRLGKKGTSAVQKSDGSCGVLGDARNVRVP